LPVSGTQKCKSDKDQKQKMF